MDDIEKLRAEVAELTEAVRALAERIDIAEGVNTALTAALNVRAYQALANEVEFRDEDLAPVKSFEALMADAILEQIASVASLQDDAINDQFLLGLESVANALRESVHRAKSRKLDRR